MSDHNEPVEFATVFRHELAAIADRRRFQHMEGLRQLGADGDYSRTARQWALEAARQNALLAEQAAVAVVHLPALIEPFSTQTVDVARISQVFRTISEQAGQLLAESDSRTGGRSSRSHLQKAAADAAEALADQSAPEEAAREVQAHLYRVLVAREPRTVGVEGGTGSPTQGDIEGLKKAVTDAAEASKQAAEQQAIVESLAQRIETAANANSAAEAVAKLLATAGLFEGQIVDQPEVFASGTAALDAILRTCHVAQVALGTPAAAPALTPAPAAPDGTAEIRARLLKNALQALEKTAEIFRAVTEGCTGAFQTSPLGELASQALRGLFETVLERLPDLPVEQRQKQLLEAESWPVGELSKQALAFLDRVVQSLGGQLRPADKVSVSLNLLHEVNQLSGQCSIDAFRLLPGEKATKFRTEKSDQTELDARRSKEIATEAVQELGKSAILVARSAWAAETRAVQAIREATAILARRFRDNPSGPASFLGGGPPPVPVPDLEHLRTQALDRGLVGLAFSGGGIRSATFGLGVLQALGHLRLLRFFDYFSTVSGGGYIGSWLAAWIHREQSLVNVEKQLDPDRIQQAKADRVVKRREDAPGDPTANPHYPLRAGAVDDEPEPVQHLRAYSRYLAPRLFSADTWTLVAIYLRNLVINLTSLAPWVFTLILISRLLIWGFTLDAQFAAGAVQTGVTVLFLVSVSVLVFWGYRQRARLREAFRDPLMHPDGADRIHSYEGVLLLAAAVLATTTALWLFSYSPPNEATVERMHQPELEQRAALFGASTVGLRHPGYHWLHRDSPFRAWSAALEFTLGCGLGVFVLSVLGGVVRCLIHRRFRGELFGLLLIADTLMGLGLGLFVYLALELVIWPAGTDSAAVVTFGIPALLTALVLADYLEMVFVGSFLDESEREWRSRIGAVLFMIALGWLVFFCATLYLPWGVQQLLKDQGFQGTVLSLLAAVWAVVSGFGAWAGKWLQSKSTSGWSIPWLRLLAMIAPPVFLIGLLGFAAGLTFLVSPAGSSDYLDIACASSGSSGSLLLWWLAVGVLGVVLVWNLIRVNLFSLHMLYANRLIRCYLGASRRKQNWNRRASGPVRNSQGKYWWLWGAGTRGCATHANVPAPGQRARHIARREPTFTDFDPADDLPLRELRPVAPVAPARGEPGVEPDEGYRGPYPLVNTALNLIGSADLAIQDRRAASFVLTPDFCGSSACGYARTRGDYLTLGRAMTISGAAVDPNMGYWYSPPLTALMTVLNTRLGWWLQNPAQWRQRWEGAGPGAGPLILWELFGQTNETSRYVHLSDGGHFENLGVYELIRRRCRYIVVTDATEDRHAATVNLANLIRLVRTDFGIGIQVDTEQLAEGPNAHTRWHCAIGLIHYEDVDPRAVAGVLVYLYSSLTGDEPPDIQQYAQTNPAFPHDTTLDQFFSEAQFESYRALGYHIATEVLGAAARTMNRACCDPETAQREVREFFSSVRKRWFPPPPGAEQQFLQAANLYLGVARDLRAEVLQRLRQELYPEAPDGSPPGPPPPPLGLPSASTELHMVNEMLQTMEMVWFGMKLDSNHAHSLNRGWMNLFRRWTNSPSFHRHWPWLRGEFSRGFVDFCEQALNMTPTDAVPLPMQGAALRTWLPEVHEMDLEFVQEWASERDRLRWLTTGRYVIDAVAIANQFQHDHAAQGLTRPLVWRLAMRDDQGSVMKRSAGVVCVGPPYLAAGRDLELFLWLRGPYRNLGIGRLCLPPVLEAIGQAMQNLPRPGGSRYRLVTYYPDSGVDKADRLAKAQWMNFFFDHRFRSLVADDPAAVPGVLSLALEL
jgi:hypothetical protein